MAVPPSTSPPDAAAAFYTGGRGRAYHEGKRGLNPTALAWVHAARAEKFQPWIRATDTVLELGVGAGWNLAHLTCARRIGVDAADFLAEPLRTLGIEFAADTRGVPDATADVALCHHALEHFAEPTQALRELRRVLKSSGRLVLHVPWEVERKFAVYRPDDPNHHLYHWNAQNLGNLVTVLGWQIESIRVRHYGYDRAAARLAERLHVGAAGFRALRALMIRLRPCREVELVARPGPSANPAP